MDAGDVLIRPIRWRWLRAAAMLVAAGLAATVVQGNDIPSTEAAALFAWARERLDQAKFWDSEIAGQAAVVQRLSGRVAAIDDRIDELTPVAESAFQLQVIPRDGGADGRPRVEPNLVVVTLRGHALGLHVFDHKGEPVPEPETDAAKRKRAQQIAVFRSYLEPLRASGGWNEDIKKRVIFLALSIVGLVESDFLDRLGKALERRDKSAREFTPAGIAARSLPPNVARLVMESARWRLENAQREVDHLREYKLKDEAEWAGVKADDEIAVVLRPQRSRLDQLESQEQRKLDELESRARAAALSREESEIVKHLEQYVIHQKAGQDGPAARELAEASRLWRREMAERFAKGLDTSRSRPVSVPDALPADPPGH
jgi:hypothetical protein